MAWNKNNIKHSCFYTHILMKYITTTFKKARRREWKHVKVLTLPLKWCIVKGRLSYRYTVSVQFTQSCLTLCNPWTPARQASLVHHQLLESTQTHVHWVGDAIKPSHPLSSPSPLALSLSQHQGLFKWVSSLCQVASIGVSASASVLPMNIKDWFPLGWTSWISLQSKGLSRVFSNTTVQKHQFFSTQLSSQSNSHIHTWPLEKP